MANKSKEEYDFVETPSEDFFCPVTFELLLDVHQTQCCEGNHLSQAAVERLQREGQHCPFCRKVLRTVHDYYFRRKVKELKVRCRNKRFGCPWVGELRNLSSHLEEDSVDGDCQHVEVSCPNSCDARFQRRQLAAHKSNICPKRPFTCQYCEYEATYEDVTNNHRPVCEKYPLPCPNACEVRTFERRHLQHHLDETCPLQEIECEFSYAGCGAKLQRRSMQTHLNENTQTHLSMVADQLKKEMQLRSELQRTVGVLIRAISAVPNSQPLPSMFIPPPVLTMTDFEKHKRDGDRWHSLPFYSYIGGYKMCISVDANGWGDGEGTHVRVAVNMMRGEYDDHLCWPFRGEIIVQLLNQRRDRGHWEKTIVFGDTARNEVAGRVVGMERARIGRGRSKFISHTDLNYNTEENTQYLQNNCLKFKVTDVVMKST